MDQSTLKAAAERRARRFRRQMVLFGGFLVTVLWGVTIAELMLERGNILRGAQREAQTLSVSLASDVGTSFDAMELALEVLAADWRRGVRGGKLDQRLRDVVARLPYAANGAVVDETGRVAASSLGVAAEIDLSDRAHVKAHFGVDPPAGLYVGMPVRGRVSDIAVVPLSLAIESDGGETVGVVIITLDSHSLAELFGQLNLGAESAIVLATAQGRVLVQKPVGYWGDGHPFYERLFATALARQPQGSFVTRTRDGAGSGRIVGYTLLEKSWPSRRRRHRARQLVRGLVD